MNRSLRLSIVLFLFLACLPAACTGGESPPAAEPTSEVVDSPLPPPAVTAEATNTFIPIIEAQVTPTAESTPTLTPTDVPDPSPTAPAPIEGITLLPVITQGLDQPTFLTHAFDGRLFVLERDGRIRIIEDGQLLTEPFLDIDDRVSSNSSEQGLLGLAFHPDYASDGAPHEGHFFVNYTDNLGDTHISRFSVASVDPNRADPQSEVEYLFQDQPFPNHNGGMLAFGPDGYLYAGLGDGGSADDPLEAGQSLETLLGKVLRLDVDSLENEYAIPPGNPFDGQPGALPEIWAFGLRNPWRFSFDRETGDLFIADVGQRDWEEVNFQPGNSSGGENYGWSIMEGSNCFLTDNCDQSGLALPVFEYGHDQGCSVTGGYRYRGDQFPDMQGAYFVADYCSGLIWRLAQQSGSWQAAQVLDSGLVISSFGEDSAGEIYLLDYGSGGVYHVTP